MDKQIQHKYYPNKRSDVEAFPNYYSSYPTSKAPQEFSAICFSAIVHYTEIFILYFFFAFVLSDSVCPLPAMWDDLQCLRDLCLYEFSVLAM